MSRALARVNPSRYIVVLAAVVATACGRTQPDVAAAQPVPPPAALAPTIAGWMECEECTEGELQAVARLGGPGVAPLAEILRSGPSPDNIARKRAYLQAQYRQRAEYAKTHPESRPAMSEEQLVASYARTYATTYRVRAAQALGLIATPEARAALTQALQLPLSETERAAVQKALQ